jgi:aspartate aminotransferase
MLSERMSQEIKQISPFIAIYQLGQQIKKEFGKENVFDLSIGSPVLEPPPILKETLVQLAQDKTPGLHKYMGNAGYLSTRQAVAKTLSKETSLPYSADCIIMSCGASAAIVNYFHAILDTGDEVILLAPYFPLYPLFVKNFGATPIVVQTKEDFQIDFVAIEAALNQKTRCVILNTPNNPSGAIYPKEDLKKLSDLLKNKQIKFGTQIDVLSDEVYSSIIYTGVPHASFSNYYENTIVVNSYSKALSIAGERIGYAAIHPKYPDKNSLFQGMTFSLEIMGLSNAPALMQRLVERLQNEKINVKAYEEKRDYIYSELINIGYDIIKPEGALYLYPKSPVEDDVQFARQLLEHQVLVLPGIGFGKPGYFRVSFSVEDWEIEGALKGFKQVMKNL